MILENLSRSWGAGLEPALAGPAKFQIPNFKFAKPSRRLRSCYDANNAIMIRYASTTTYWLQLFYLLPLFCYHFSAITFLLSPPLHLLSTAITLTQFSTLLLLRPRVGVLSAHRPGPRRSEFSLRARPVPRFSRASKMSYLKTWKTTIPVPA